MLRIFVCDAVIYVYFQQALLSWLGLLVVRQMMQLTLAQVIPQMPPNTNKNPSLPVAK